MTSLRSSNPRYTCGRGVCRMWFFLLLQVWCEGVGLLFLIVSMSPPLGNWLRSPCRQDDLFVCVAFVVVAINRQRASTMRTWNQAGKVSKDETARSNTTMKERTNKNKQTICGVLLFVCFVIVVVVVCLFVRTRIAMFSLQSYPIHVACWPCNRGEGERRK
jgi:hypothetical protein